MVELGLHSWRSNCSWGGGGLEDWTMIESTTFRQGAKSSIISGYFRVHHHQAPVADNHTDLFASSYFHNDHLSQEPPMNTTHRQSDVENSDNSAIGNAESTTFGFCSINPLPAIDGDAVPLSSKDQLQIPLFDNNYMPGWDEQHMLDPTNEQLLKDGLLFSDLDGDNYDNKNNDGEQSVLFMHVPLPPLPDPDSVPFELDSGLYQEMEPPTPVRAPVPKKRKNQKKRKLVPHDANLAARQALRDALFLLKKCRRDIEKAPGQCDGGILQLSIKALTNTFNNEMSTPLSQCLPPLPNTIVALTHKMRVEKVQVVRVESNSIVVKALNSKKIGHAPEQWSFVFTNGEWVCGERVLFI